MRYTIEYNRVIYAECNTIADARKCACDIADKFDVHAKINPTDEEVIIYGCGRWEMVWKNKSNYGIYANDGTYNINPLNGKLMPYRCDGEII